jgi:FMN-dependent oxidoreductase (nitrilotriacetate monooxygenase family)
MDLMSGGRLGWNIVTSSSELAAKNFGMDGLPPHDDRYDIADEYLDVCKQLWDSWAPGAVLADVETGVFADAAKVHEVNFEGPSYKVLGPLNVPQSPQGRPVLAQAGASPRGMRFAARHADIVLTPVNYPPAIKAFRDEIRRLAAEEGRDPDSIKVMALAFPHVFEDKAGVDAFRASLHHVPDRVVIAWLAQLSAITGIDFSLYDLDKPLPDHVQTEGSRGTLDWLRGGGATVRQMGLKMARLMPDTPMVGTAEEVAAEMDDVMQFTGGDGFLIAGPFSTRYVGAISDLLVPELRKRGLVRADYAQATLRDHLLEY